MPYGFFLIITLFVSNRQRLRKFWILYLLACILGLICQYMALLGFPDGLCTNYNDFWTDITHSKKVSTSKQQFAVISWLYLPATTLPSDSQGNLDTDAMTDKCDGLRCDNYDPTIKPDLMHLVYDAIQLIFVLCQWMVFNNEYKEIYQKKFGSNTDILDTIHEMSFKKEQIKVSAILTPNFLHKEARTTLDYLKTAILCYGHWVTLAIVAAAGIMRVTIFSFIYVGYTFYLLAVIQTVMTNSIRRLVKLWNWLIIYSAFVLFAKALIVRSMYWIKIANKGYTRSI